MSFQLCQFAPSSQNRFFFMCGMNNPSIEEMRRLKKRASALRNAGVRIGSILCSEDPANVAMTLQVYNEIGGDRAKLSTAWELTNFERYPLTNVDMPVIEAAAQARGLSPEVYMMKNKEYDDHIWRLGMRAGTSLHSHMSKFRPGVTFLVSTHEGRIDSLLFDILGKSGDHQYQRNRPLIKPGEIVEVIMVRDTKQVLYMQHLTNEILGVGEIDLPA